MGDGGSKSRVERRKEKTRRKIITVAIRLIKQYGFDATTMEQIAEEADIAKGTLYNYFPAKEAIISAHVQQAFEERHIDRVRQLQQMPDTRSRLALLLGDLMERVQVQQDIFELYLAHRVRQVVSLRPDMSEGVKSGFSSLAVEIIQLGQQSAEIRTDLPLNMLTDLFEFVFVEVAKQFYLEPDTYEVNAAIEQGVSLFMNGAEERR
jgi:AcrR family transcriptional regulator